jgi:hypothetical protein
MRSETVQRWVASAVWLIPGILPIAVTGFYVI